MAEFSKKEKKTRNNKNLVLGPLTQKIDYKKESKKIKQKLNGADLKSGEITENWDTYYDQKVKNEIVEINNYHLESYELFKRTSPRLKDIRKKNHLNEADFGKLFLFDLSLWNRVKILRLIKSTELVVCITKSGIKNNTSSKKNELVPTIIITRSGEPRFFLANINSLEGAYVLLIQTNPPVKIIEKDQAFVKEQREQKKKKSIFSIPSFSPAYYP